MILSDISVKRPVFATVLSLMLIAFGVLAFNRLPLRELPDIDPPVVSIQTQYPGASAAVIDTRITQVIEDAISGLEGIRTVESSSQDERSGITIEFNLSRDIDGAANDVRDAVSRVIDRLPDDAEPPEVSKADADSQPVIWLSLRSENRNQLELRDFAERIMIDRLSVIDGVARVNIGGAGRYAMRIWPDRKAMAARAITITDIEDALRRENVELPGGSIESSNRNVSIRVNRSYRQATDFAQLPIKTGADGHVVRLGEIATTELGSSIEHLYMQGNGKPQIGLGITKQSTANTIDVVKGVRAEVERIKPTLPSDIEFEVNFDTSLFIEEAIHEVYVTLSVAMALVIGVIYLFLGQIRTAIIPAVTVPVCLIGSFIALEAFGLSINLMTLLALVLAIGLVVDDAIVVLENIQRRTDQGEPPLVAAFRGTRQVAFAVLATTSVLIAVFVPVMFIGGTIGRLFAELAVAMGSAVTFSALVALSLTPMMCSKILKPSTEKKGFAHWVDKIFERVRRNYIEALRFCLDRPKPVFAVIGASLLGIVLLWQVIPSELAPEEDRGFFNISIRAPEGAGYDYMLKQTKAVEAIVLDYVGKGDVDRVNVRIPNMFGSSGTDYSGWMMVAMAPWSQRDKSAKDVMGEMGRRLYAIPGVNSIPLMQQPIGRAGPGGQPVQFVIGGSDYEELTKWRDIMLQRIADNPRLLGVDTDYKETKPQLKVDIDRNRAASLGVPVQTIGRTLATMLGSSIVTTYASGGEEYDVILRVRSQDRTQMDDLTNIYVRSDKSGELIPLSNLVTMREVGDAGALRRFNRMRAITISATLAPGYTLGEALTYLERTAREALPHTAIIDYRGASRAYKESSSSLYFTFGLALLVIFLVLAAQFESFVHPIVILLSVPLALLGGMLALYLTGTSLNIYSQIGIIMLIGLAAKNGILIVEFTNQLRDQGRAFKDALVEAASVRLRPIIMTSLATAFGAVPLLIASGPGAASRFSIGIVIFAGVLGATMLTVFVVPVFYMLLAQNTGSPQAVARKLATLEAQSGPQLSAGE